MKIVISSGHWPGAGAHGIISEVTEARRVVERVADFLRPEHEVITYHDNVSNDVDENLDRIVSFHNAQGAHDLDVSVHFNNAYPSPYSKPIGTECFHYAGNDDMRELAAAVASEIALASGLKDRGPKDDGLYFTNHTAEPSILIEVCFVESEPDVDLYRRYFEGICEAIAVAITGGDEMAERPPAERPPIEPPATMPPEDALFYARGSCSWFGGPEDDGVSPSEGLAFLYDVGDAPHLFLPEQPSGTSGLARRLDPGVFYVACRWDYGSTSKDMLRNQMRKVLVRAGDQEFLAYPADWGPDQDTGRVADLSPALMEALDLSTDDEVEIIYPAPE